MGNEIQVPDAGSNPGRKITPPTNRDSINFFQIQSALAVANTVMAFLTNASLSEENMPHKGPMDGGVKLAAEHTLVQVLSRIDTLVADESRWTMEEQNNLEKTLLNLYEEQRSLLQYQHSAISIMKAPHTRFKPTLIKLDNGTWAAYHGDPASEATSIIGSGASPEDALANFDEVFVGKIYEHKEKTMDGAGTIIPEREPGKADAKPDRKTSRANSGIRRGKKSKDEKPPKKGADGSAGL